MNGGQDNSRSEGMILIVVLWAVSLMTLAVVAISALSQKSIDAAGAETGRLRSKLALEAGLAAGNAMILATQKEQRVFLDGSPITIDIGNGRQAEIRVRDAAGFIDLNRADLGLIEAALGGLASEAGSAKSLIAALRELRPEQKEGQSEKDGQQPASDPDQQGQAQPQGQQPAANQTGQMADSGESQQDQNKGDGEPAKPPVLTSTAELYGFKDVSPEVVDKLLPFITLYSSNGGKVNPMAAPPEILRLIPGLGDNDRMALEEAKRRKQVQTPAAQAALAGKEKFLSIEEPRTFLVSIRLVSGPGIIAGSRLAASVVLDDSGKEAFQIFDWSW